jgi:cation transport ATPase
MLSGDNKQTARAAAAQLGFEDENVIAEVLPEEKHDSRLALTAPSLPQPFKRIESPPT